MGQAYTLLVLVGDEEAPRVELVPIVLVMRQPCSFSVLRLLACAAWLVYGDDLFAALRTTPVLLVGDSVMEQQYSALVKWRILKRENVFHPRSACYNEPQTVEDSLFAAVAHLKRPPGLIYLNFQSLHHLHLHPLRPWTLTESCGCSGDDQCNAGFFGAFLFEEWIYSVVNQYLASPLLLPNSSSSSSSSSPPPVIIIMTPNAVCERSFYGSYLAWFDSAELHLRDCAAWLQASFAAHCPAPHGCRFSASSAAPWWQTQLPVDHLLASVNASRLPTSLHQAEVLCREGVFGRSGSRSLAKRLRRLVQRASEAGAENGASWRARVAIVDSFALSDEAGCLHTSDGRHYDGYVLDKQVDELARVFNALRG